MTVTSFPQPSPARRCSTGTDALFMPPSSLAFSAHRPVSDRINYLHFGETLSCLSQLDLSSAPRRLRKRDFLQFLKERGLALPEYVRVLVDNYSPSAHLDVARFVFDLASSFDARDLFAQLRCRGFSYAWRPQMCGFPYRLRAQVNLRMALVADRTLFYPPSVRRHVARHRRNHYFHYDSPAIGFALGVSTPQGWHT